MFLMKHSERCCSTCGKKHYRNHRYCAGCHATYMRTWRKSHLDKRSQQTNARNVANVYHSRGKLAEPKACSSCGVEGQKFHKHHEDYSQPLAVTWLCRACHMLAHDRVAAVLETA